jgi:type IV secretory pathway component VirB8
MLTALTATESFLLRAESEDGKVDVFTEMEDRLVTAQESGGGYIYSREEQEISRQ